MTMLALDTACDAVSCALSRDDRIVGEVFLNAGLKHSVTLMRSVDDLLRLAGTDKRDLDAVAVIRGPGSFTGIRIGVATASALAYGLDIPVFPVSSLDALIAGAGDDGPVCAILDARRGEVYVKAPDVIPESAMPLREVLEKLESVSSPLFTGDAAPKFRTQILQRIPTARFLPESLCYPRAQYALAAVKQGRAEKGRHDTLRASYLRPSQAERLRKERQ